MYTSFFYEISRNGIMNLFINVIITVLAAIFCLELATNWSTTAGIRFFPGFWSNLTSLSSLQYKFSDFDRKENFITPYFPLIKMRKLARKYKWYEKYF